MGAGLGDEVVAVVVAADPPEVEVQCHGGPAAVALVVDDLVARGAERRQPVAWVRHAARSLIEAEAEVDLARAPTVRTAEILLEQAQGALAGEVRRLRARIDDDPEAALAGLEALRAAPAWASGWSPAGGSRWRAGPTSARADCSTPWRGTAGRSSTTPPGRPATS